jgi:dihydroorotate dehydrogenase
MESSHSGLVRHLGKVVYPKGYRGFKSLTLRQFEHMKQKIIGTTYRNIIKPVLFRIDPEKVHDHFLNIGKKLGGKKFGKTLTGFCFLYKHKALEQEILGIQFDNPVGLAAGFDKNAELTDILPAVGFGFQEVGSITGELCEGNPKPRLWRIPETKSLRVYYGLKNNGADDISFRLRDKIFDIPIGVSIAKTNSPATVDLQEGIADYIKAAEAFRDIGSYITLNISCPNAYGGEPFSNPERLDKLLEAYYALNITKPTFIKIAAGLENTGIDAILEVGERHGIDGYICTNLKKNKGEKGGLSGKAVDVESDETISYIYKSLKGKRIVVGCGGVFSGEDAYRKIRKGASLVQLITGMIYQGPQLIGEINHVLVELLKRDGFSNISEAVGVDNV